VNRPYKNLLSTPKALANFSPNTPKALANFSPSTPKALANFSPSTPKALANFSPSTPKALANFSPGTPKALANFSPGFELARTLGQAIKHETTLKGFVLRRTLSGLEFFLCAGSQGSRKLEPSAEISQRLRRFQNEPAR